MSQLRAPFLITEASVSGYANALSPLVLNEPLIGGYAAVRASLVTTEPLIGGYSKARLCTYLIETLFPVGPEEIMVTITLPGFGNSIGTPSIPAASDPLTSLPGLAFSVHKKPMFATRVNESVAFDSIRSKLAPYPRWQFELTYEFLEDHSGANSSLKQMLGFWLSCGGKALPFLFKDPDDYLVTNGAIAATDGATLQWDFLRAIGPFSEPVGQVDTVNTVNVYISLSETLSVPATGPYTVTVAHAAAFIEDQGVKISGTPLVKVASSPATGQYSVATGVYTFNSAQHGASAVITYRYLVDPTAYTVTMPNKLVFGSAPASGGQISADFQFFFTCFFDDDETDYEKFANQLWALQSLKFHSELLA